VVITRPVGRFCLSLASGTDVPPVALVRTALDDDGRILPTLAAHGFRGVVIEGFGGGHVMPAMVSRIERLATEMPVVLANSSTTSSSFGIRPSAVWSSWYGVTPAA
jgi:L-asparaginase